MAEAIEGEQLVVERGGRAIISGLSFRATAGRALLLLGANGAGKTTLIRACAGLLPARSGRIALRGGDPELTIGEQCHYVGHLNALKASMTVRENLMFWAEFLSSAGVSSGVARPRDAVARSLERFRLTSLADAPAGYLSAGQKRRAALARLLVASRPLWLLDEPTVALDIEMRELFVEVVDEHLKAGGLVVAATHLPLPFSASEELRLGAGTEVFA